jgi:hypothetical protein
MKGGKDGQRNITGTAISDLIALAQLKLALNHLMGDYP